MPYTNSNQVKGLTILLEVLVFLPFVSQLSGLVEVHQSYLGFSSGSGSLRARPTGFFSASSAVTKWNSASTFPYSKPVKYSFQ